MNLDLIKTFIFNIPVLTINYTIHQIWLPAQHIPASLSLKEAPSFLRLCTKAHTIKVATVASRWQRVGDLIGSEFEPHTSRNRSKCLTTCALRTAN